MNSVPQRQRSARRRGKREAQKGAGSAINQLPFAQPVNHIAPTRLVSDDELEAIHNASLDILENLGIKFINAEAQAILRQAGAEVSADDDLVKFDRELILQSIASCPAEYTVLARNPAHSVHIGGNRLAFSIMSSAPNCSDMDNGRRSGTQQDFRNFIKFSQYFNAIHLNAGGYPVEPIDVHASVRHLDCIADMVRLTDKVFHIYSLGQQRNLDGLEIARIAHGVDAETFAQQPRTMTVINTNSPRKIDDHMLQGIIEMSSRNQVVIITPFTLAGAMAPITLAGALAQQNAEALAAIAFSQMVRPGAPVIYGGFTSNVDMRSGSPAFGTPEYMKTEIVGGQLARRYNLPYRTSNVCSANTVDAQAGYESVFSLWGAVSGGGNLIKHAAGWTEGGLCFSYEKMMLDIDLLQMVAEFLKPMEVTEDSLALDAVAEVGTDGHYFGAAHTMERYDSAFYSPLVSDWRNFETWQEAGSPTAMEKANRLWKQCLADYSQPALDPAIDDELETFITKRKNEGGVATDF